MSQIQLQFENHIGHVTPEMLNAAYGTESVTFRTLEMAERFRQKHPGSRIYRLRNYNAKDVIQQLKGMPLIKEGALDFTIGYLVNNINK